MKNPAPTDEMHTQFLRALDASDAALWVVAQRLRQRGYPVTVNVAGRAPTAAQAMEYADGGDLTIGQRVEVKRLGVDFTGRHDWPFGDQFIVCARHAFDRALPRPMRYVILSQSMTHAAVVRGEDRSHWRVETRADRRRAGRVQEFYLSPIERVRFCRVEDL